MAVPRRERANGQKEVRASAGPMGRCVADLELIMRVWLGLGLGLGFGLALSLALTLTLALALAL